MKKSIFILTLTITLLCIISAASAIDIALPAPEKNGGPGVLSAISARSSADQKSFMRKELSLKELSTILWAATGKNRKKPQGWTIPLAMGKEPYVSVYVIMKNGSYVYDWGKNRLKLISNKNNLSNAGSQAFVATAPCVLVFATKGTGPSLNNWEDISVGAMSQNVYLAAEALSLKTRFIVSFNKEALIKALSLHPLSRIISIMPLGVQ